MSEYSLILVGMASQERYIQYVHDPTTTISESRRGTDSKRI